MAYVRYLLDAQLCSHHYVVPYRTDESAFASVNELLLSTVTVNASDNRLTLKYAGQIRLVDNNLTTTCV